MRITRSILAIAVPVLAIAACADLQDMNAAYAVARSWCEKRAECGDPTVGDEDQCIISTESLVQREGGSSSFRSSTPTDDDKERLFACADAVRDGACPAQFAQLPSNCGFSSSYTADTGTSDTGGSDTESSDTETDSESSETGTTDTSSSETRAPSCKEVGRRCIVEGREGFVYDCTASPIGCFRMSSGEYCCFSPPPP